MVTKKTSKKSRDKSEGKYNKAYDEGFSVGEWVVQMLSGGPMAFIIPANPYAVDTSDYEMNGYNGWRDGFHGAVATYCEGEDVSFHEVLTEYVGRFRRST